MTFGSAGCSDERLCCLCGCVVIAPVIGADIGIVCGTCRSSPQLMLLGRGMLRARRDCVVDAVGAAICVVLYWVWVLVSGLVVFDSADLFCWGGVAAFVSGGGSISAMVAFCFDWRTYKRKRDRLFVERLAA